MDNNFLTQNFGNIDNYGANVFESFNQINDLISKLYYSNPNAPKGDRKKQSFENIKKNIGQIINIITNGAIQNIDDRVANLVRQARADVDYKKSQWSKNEDKNYYNEISKIQGALQRTVNDLYRGYIEETIKDLSALTNEGIERLSGGSKFGRKIIEEKKRELLKESASISKIARTLSNQPVSAIDSFIKNIEQNQDLAYDALQNHLKVREELDKISKKYELDNKKLKQRVMSVRKAFETGVSGVENKGIQVLNKNSFNKFQRNFSKYSANSVINRVYSGGIKKENASSFTQNYLEDISNEARRAGRKLVLGRDSRGEYILAFPEKNVKSNKIDWSRVPKFRYGSLDDVNGLSMRRNGGRGANNIIVLPNETSNRSGGFEVRAPRYSTTAEYMLEEVGRVLLQVRQKGGESSSAYERRLKSALSMAEKNSLRGMPYDYAGAYKYDEPSNESMSRRASRENSSNRMVIRPMIDAIMREIGGSNARQESDVVKGVYDLIGAYRAQMRGTNDEIKAIANLSKENDLYSQILSSATAKKMLKDLSSLPLSPQYGSNAARAGGFIQLAANLENAVAAIGWDASRHVSQGTNFGDLTKAAMFARRNRSAPIFKTQYGKTNKYDYDDATERLYRIQYITEKQFLDKWNEWASKNPELAATVGVVPGLHDNASIMRRGIDGEFDISRQRHKAFGFEEYNRAQRKLVSSGKIKANFTDEEKQKAVIGYLMGIEPGDVLSPNVFKTESGFDANFSERVRWSNPKTLGRYTGYRSESSYLPEKFFNDMFSGVDVLRGIEQMSANDLGGLLISRLTDIYLDPKSDKEDVKRQIGQIFAGTKYADMFDIKDDEIVARFLGQNIDLNKEEQKKILGNIRQYFPSENFTIQEGLNAAYDYRWLNGVKYGRREIEAIKRAAGPEAEDFVQHYENIYNTGRREAVMKKVNAYQNAFGLSFSGGDKGVPAFDVSGAVGDSRFDYRGPYVTEESYNESNLKKFYDSMGGSSYGLLDLGPFGYSFDDAYGNKFSSSKIIVPNISPEAMELFDRLGGEADGSLGYMLSSFDESLNSVIRSLADYNRVVEESKDDQEAIQRQFNKTQDSVNRFMSEYRRYAFDKDSSIIDQAYHTRMPGGKFFEATAIAMGQNVVGAKDAVFLSPEAMGNIIGNDRADLSAVYRDVFGRGPAKRLTNKKIKEDILKAVTLGAGVNEKGVLLQDVRFPSIQGQDVRFLRAFVDSTMTGSEAAKIGYGAADSNRTDYDRDHFALVSAFLGMNGMDDKSVGSFIKTARKIQENHKRVSEAIARVREIRGEDAEMWREDLVLPTHATVETASFAGAANRGEIGLISSQATEARRFLDSKSMSEMTGVGASAAIGQMVRYLFESVEQDAISYKHIINKLNRENGQLSPQEFAQKQTEAISQLRNITAKAWDKNNPMSLREYFSELKDIGVFKDTVGNKALIQMAQQASAAGGNDFKRELMRYADRYKSSEFGTNDTRTAQQIVNDFLVTDEASQSARNTIGTIPFEMLMYAADYIDKSVSKGNRGTFLHQALVSANRLEGDMSTGDYSIGRWLREHGATRQTAPTPIQKRIEAMKKAIANGEAQYTVDGKRYGVSAAEQIAATQGRNFSDRDWEILMRNPDSYASAVLAAAGNQGGRFVSGFSPIFTNLRENPGHYYVDENGNVLPDAITASKLGSILSGSSYHSGGSEFLELLDAYSGDKFSIEDIAKHGYTVSDINNFERARSSALSSIFGTLQHKEMEVLGEALDVSMDDLFVKDNNGNNVLNKDVLSKYLLRFQNTEEGKKIWAQTEDRLKKFGYSPEHIGSFGEASIYSTLAQSAISKSLGYQVAAREFSVGQLGKTALADRYFAGTIDQVYFDPKTNQLIVGDSKNKSGRDDFSQLMQLSYGRYALSQIQKELQGENFLGAAQKYGLVDENGKPTDFANILKTAELSENGTITRFNPTNDKVSAYRFKLLSNENMERALADAAAGVVYSQDQQQSLVSSADISEIMGASIAPGTDLGRAIDIFSTKGGSQLSAFAKALDKRSRLKSTLGRLAMRGEQDSYAYLKAEEELEKLEGEGGALYMQDGSYAKVDQGVSQEMAKKMAQDSEDRDKRIQEQILRDAQKKQKDNKMFSGAWWLNDLASGPATAFNMLFRGGVTTKIILKLFGDMKKVVQITEQLNASMTNLRIITGKNAEEANSMMKAYNGLAKELGVTTAAIAQVGAEWLRQGYNIQETENLIEASTKLAKLGFMDQGAAVKSLTAAMKGFNLSATESMSIVDKLTTLDAKYATTAGDIATALTRVASVANNAGMSLDETAAAITAIIDTTQQDAGTVGNALKTMLSRYGNVKAGSFAVLEGAEEGDAENINDVERVLGALGIQIRTSKMEMRDFADVLDDIAEKWTTLTTVEQNAIAVALGGVRQRNTTVALLNSYQTYKKALEDEETSAGRANRKYEAYKNSIEFQKQELQVAWEGLVLKIDQSPVIKGLLRALTLTVEHADKWVPVLISAVPLLRTLINNRLTSHKQAIIDNTNAENENTAALRGESASEGTPGYWGTKVKYAHGKHKGEETAYTRGQIAGITVGSMVSSGLSYGAAGGGIIGNKIDEHAGTSEFENGVDSVISGVTGAAGAGIGAAIGTMIAPGIGTALGATLGPILLDPIASLFKWLRHRDEIEMSRDVAKHKETLEAIQGVSSSMSSLRDSVDAGSSSWSSADWKRNQEAYLAIINAFESNLALRNSYKKLFGEEYNKPSGDLASLTSEEMSRLSAAQIVGEAEELFAASRIEISNLEKDRVKTLSKIAKEKDEDDLKELNQKLSSIDVDLEKYQDALQKSYLAASAITSGVSRMSAVQINNATLERVIRQVAEDWSKNNPNVFLGGTLTASARQDIINYLRGDERYSSLFKNDTQTLSSRIRAKSRAESLFGGYSGGIQGAISRLDEAGGYAKLREQYGDSGIDLLYKADAAGIERIAHALNMTTEQALKAEKSLGWVTDATVANGIDGLAESFSSLGDILTEISHSSTISAKTMNSILENYSWLLNGENGSFGTENIMKNLLDFFTGDAMEGAIGLVAKDALTNDKTWEAFIEKYSDPKEYGALGLSEEDWLGIQGSSNFSGASGIMFNNTNALSAFAELAGELTGDFKIAEVVQKIWVEAEENALQNEISNLESIKESLEDVNKQREKELELIKAKEALENAQKEKKRVYREGIGFVYTSDQQAIKDAQENVEKLERERDQRDIQYQIDMLNQQKDILANIEKNEQLESIYKLLDKFMDGKEGSVLGSILSFNKEELAKKIQEGVTNSLDENAKSVLREEADAEEAVYTSILSDLNRDDENSWINKSQDTLGGLSVASVLQNNNSPYYDTAKQMYSDKLDQLSASSAKLTDYNKMKIGKNYDVSGYGEQREYFNELKDQNRWLRVYIPDGEGWAHSEGARDSGVMMYYSKSAQDKVPSDLKRGRADQLLLAKVGNSGHVVNFQHAETFDDLDNEDYVGYVFVNTDTSNEYGYYKGADGWHEIRLQNGERELSPPSTLRGVDNYDLLKNASGALSFSGGRTLINESGLEGIITPEGTITSLPAKSGILPADLTKNLWSLGEVAPNLITQLSGKSFNRIDEKKSEDNSMHVGTLNATFNTDSGFDAAAFWNSVKSQISLTKNNH